MVIWWIIGSVVLVSLISLVGAGWFVIGAKRVGRAMPLLVGFATGALLAAGMFDLLPESFAELGGKAPIYVVAGILLLLIFEQILHWHHEHRGDCENCHSRIVGYSVLLGDGLHNFLDGVLIASAFLADREVGIITTLAVILHEIPQELGDFAVLLKSGLKPSRALWFNFLSALAAVAGALIAYFALARVEAVTPYIVAIGAGGLLYIALVDLLSEMRTHGESLGARLAQFAMVVMGLIVVGGLGAILKV
ncbi:MAG: ZIP family metal transporter [bacterium]